MGWPCLETTTTCSHPEATAKRDAARMWRLLNQFFALKIRRAEGLAGRESNSRGRVGRIAGKREAQVRRRPDRRGDELPHPPNRRRAAVIGRSGRARGRGSEYRETLPSARASPIGGHPCVHWHPQMDHTLPPGGGRAASQLRSSVGTGLASTASEQARKGETGRFEQRARWRALQKWIRHQPPFVPAETRL